MRPILIAIRHIEIGGRTFRHGAEIPQGVLAQDEIDKLIDRHRLAESPERRSLFRLFPAFSGATENEQLSSVELDDCALPK
jgi:hypothetical protein